MCVCLSCVKEFLCEFKLTNVQSHQSSRADVCDFLFDFVSRRFSSTGSSELHLQHTLDTWNRYTHTHTQTMTSRYRDTGTETQGPQGSLTQLDRTRWFPTLLSFCSSFRVLLSLPPLLLVKVRSEGGRKTVDCSRLIQHINQHQVSPHPLRSFTLLLETG